MISPVGYSNLSIPYAGVNTKGSAVDAVSKINGVRPVSENSALSVGNVKSSECQTCNNRKYMDRSNDGNVSFQTPTHVSPQASFAMVSAHEQEHVSNAYSEGAQAENKLISSSVTLKMDSCSECGTPYVAGGTTRTQIQYNVSNPYENSRKSIEGSLLKGMNFDAVA